MAIIILSIYQIPVTEAVPQLKVMRAHEDFATLKYNLLFNEVIERQVLVRRRMRKPGFV